MQDLRAMLLSQIERVPGPLESECWLYRGKTEHTIVRWQGESHNAHRLSHIAFIGPIKLGYFCCHRCDVGGCINPDHLFQDTPQGNTQDAIAKGRFHFIPSTSERGRNAKLSEAEVSQIKEFINGGRSQREIAALFDISPNHVSSIKTEKSWPLVEPRIVELQPINCRWCQREFVPSRHNSRFCSKQCTDAWHTPKQKLARLKQRPTVSFLRRF